MTSTDLVRQDATERVRQPFPVTLVCTGCSHPFVAVLWYRSQRKAYCSDLCREATRDGRRVPLADRFWTKVNRAGPISEHRPDLGPCWLWTGSKTAGYGTLYSGETTVTGHNRPLLAHRLSYELNVGPIRQGLTIDHLCRVTACVNPGHLEPVTMAVNILRSESPSARHARADNCKRGHPKTEANTYRSPDGRAECQSCRQIRWADFSAKRRDS